MSTVSVFHSTFANTLPLEAVTSIKHFNDALIATMKAGKNVDFDTRCQRLAPVIDQTFDLTTVLSVSVGLSWSTMTPDQQKNLLTTFRNYTIASYVANFDSYNGQQFSEQLDSTTSALAKITVKTQFKPTTGDVTNIDYLMTSTTSGWKVVDVLLAGSISRVAVQRSDFRHILASGGSDALVTSLQKKTSDLHTSSK
jgi:phospholipid transport system substrate-binding protein